ncbi:MAG: hypothetical protein ACI8ZB_000726 [Desulforhopalus sp.]|jgi:hypothetical protein
MQKTSRLLTAKERQSPPLPERYFREKHKKTTDDHRNSYKKSEQVGQASQDVMAETIIVFITYIAVLEQGHFQVVQVSLRKWKDIPYSFLGITKKVEKKPDQYCA